MKKIENRPFYSRSISARRQYIGLTQKQLSEACGIPLGTIKAIEAGTFVPSFDMLFKIAKILHTFPNSFLNINVKSHDFDDYSFFKKAYDEIKKLIPPEYVLCSPKKADEEINDDIVIEWYYPDSGVILGSHPYSKSLLVYDIAQIKYELEKKYQEELKHQVENLLHEIATGNHKDKTLEEITAMQNYVDERDNSIDNSKEEKKESSDKSEDL